MRNQVPSGIDDFDADTGQLVGDDEAEGGQRAERSPTQRELEKARLPPIDELAVIARYAWPAFVLVVIIAALPGVFTNSPGNSLTQAGMVVGALLLLFQAVFIWRYTIVSAYLEIIAPTPRGSRYTPTTAPRLQSYRGVYILGAIDVLLGVGIITVLLLP